MAVRMWEPSVKGVESVAVNAPVLSAVALPTRVWPSYRETSLLASAVPFSIGVELLSGVATAVRTGLTGAVVSTVTAKADEATDILPAASLALAVRLWEPSDSGAAGVKV